MSKLMVRLRRAVCALVLSLVLLPTAYAQEIDCRTAFAHAEETYRNGLFDETIDLLNICLDRDAFSSEERRQAYRLIGLSYIGKDREEDAREAVRALLEVAPRYQPDPVTDPPPFVALVDEMRGEYEDQQPVRRRPVSSPNRASTLQGLSIGGTVHGTNFSIEESSDTGAGVTLFAGYGLTPNLTAYVRLGGSQLTDSEIDESYALGNVEVGGRFLVGSEEKRFVPYVGAGFSFQAGEIGPIDVFFEDGSVLEDFTIEYSGPGVSLGGGVLYFLTPTLSLDAGLNVILTAWRATGSAPDPFTGLDFSTSEDFTSTTVHVGVGVNWHFAR